MVFDTNQYVYFVRDTNQIADFENVVKAYDNSFSLNTCEYALDSTTILVPQRKVLVKLSDKRNLDSILRELNIEYAFVEKAPYNNNCYTIVLERDNALSTSVLLYNTGYFEYAEPDFLSSFQLLGYTDNPYYSQQWSIHNDSININLLPAWGITTGSESIKTAIVDVGIDYNHEDLISNMLPGYSAISRLFGLEAGGNNNHYESHGTYCAGIIAAENNNVGLVGVAHTSKLMSVKCADINPVGYRDMNDFYPYGHDHIYTSHLLDALDKSCYELEADVILLALTNRFRSGAVHDKFSEVCKNGRKGKGCVIVVSSGNNEMSEATDTSMSFFARHPNVISVGAVSPTGLRAVNASIYGNYYFSSCYGDSLCVVAPGVHIPTTEVYSSYVYFSGTSTAAAHVAGIAALVLSVNPCLTWDEVKFIIESTCTKIRTDTYSYNNCSDHPNGTWNIEVGYGLVNAGAAVSLAEQMGGYIYVNDTLISATEIWDTIRFMNQDLTIDSLVTLTITDSVLIANGARIIVRPGGKLIVDGGTLTSACTGEMWQGIEVVGDKHQHQVNSKQGTVVLKNGAVVENARCGVKTGLAGDTTAFATTGGIVIAQDAIFHNCAKAVEFLAYIDTTAYGVVKDNQSSFKNCTFTVDDNNLFAANNTSFLDHATLWGVKGVKFLGCTFQNLTSSSYGRRHAIYTEEAGFVVDEYCGDYTPNNNGGSSDYCGCPASLSDSCVFEGFFTAIEANTAGAPLAVTVNRAQFANNATAVRINANNFATVTESDFNLTECDEVNVNQVYGLYLDNCTGYLVEGNAFYRDAYPSSPLDPDNRNGILVKASGTPANSLYRNNFANLTKGIAVSGANSGLQIGCSSFSGNSYDISIPVGATVAMNQGSLSAGADNTFNNTRMSSIQNAGGQKLTYYYSAGNNHSPYNPIFVTLNSRATANACASTLCDGVLPPPPPFDLTSFTSLLSTTIPSPTATEHQTSTDGIAAAESPTPDEVSAIYHTAVRALMADTLLDLAALEQWHAAAQPIADSYSLTETRFALRYDEVFSPAASTIPSPAATEPQASTDGSATAEPPTNTDEFSDYVRFHNLKRELRNADENAINWYALTPAQIAQLQDLAEAGTGRSSVMARGVLCFFFNICYDDGMQMAETRRAAAKDGGGYMPVLTDDSLSFSIAFGPFFITKHDSLYLGAQSVLFVSGASDTVIFNNREYRFFKAIPDVDIQPDYRMYLREDTTTGRLYRYYPEYDIEVITCDLSLQSGDTFCISSGNYPCWIVDSVTYDEGRKVVWFPPVSQSGNFLSAQYPYHTCFIEGFGPTFGPFEIVNRGIAFDLGLLLCVHHNDSLVYMTDTVLGCEQYVISVPEYPDALMKIYPNPATNTLHVEFEGTDDPQGTITVTNITGVVVLTQECHDPVTQLDVSNLSHGLYVVSFRNEKGVIVRKFVKM